MSRTIDHRPEYPAASEQPDHPCHGHRNCDPRTVTGCAEPVHTPRTGRPTWGTAAARLPEVVGNVRSVRLRRMDGGAGYVLIGYSTVHGTGLLSQMTYSSADVLAALGRLGLSTQRAVELVAEADDLYYWPTPVAPVWTAELADDQTTVRLRYDGGPGGELRSLDPDAAVELVRIITAGAVR